MRRTAVVLTTLLLLALLGVPFAAAEWIPVFKVDILDDANTDPSDIEPGFEGWAPKISGDKNPGPTATTIAGVPNSAAMSSSLHPPTIRVPSPSVWVPGGNRLSRSIGGDSVRMA